MKQINRQSKNNRRTMAERRGIKDRLGKKGGTDNGKMIKNEQVIKEKN